MASVFQLPAGFPPAAAGRTAGGKLDDEGNKIESGGYPHEGQHSITQVGLDIQIGLGGEDILEDDEHDGSKDGGDDCDQRVEELDYKERERAEEDEGASSMGRVGFVDLRIWGDGLGRTRGDCERSEEDEDEAEDCGSQEEAEHPKGYNPDNLHCVIYIGGESD